MHLLVLGATGKTGVFSYKYALEQGISSFVYFIRGTIELTSQQATTSQC
jgi:hypothetical protein